MMHGMKVKNSALVHLSMVLIVTAIFTIFSMSLNFLDAFYGYLGEYSRLPIAELLINVVFLLLSGLLWVTYRRWQEAEREKKELEDVIDSISPDVLMVVDPDQNISMCNPSVKRMFGYEVNEVINQKTDFLYSNRQLDPKERNETFDLLFDLLIKEGFQVEWATGKKKNGDPVHLEIVAGDLHHRGGAVLLLRDITERNRMEEELEKARVEQIEMERFKAVTEMAVSLSHEINNPLCTISGIAQLILMRSEELDEDIVDQLEAIWQQSKRIEALTLKLTQIKSVTTTSYVQGQAMIDIEKSTSTK